MNRERIEVDDLTAVMIDLDSAQVIFSEVLEDFFLNLDPDADRATVAFEFRRTRAKALVVGRLLSSIEQDLRTLGADPGYPGYKERQQHEAQ